MKIGIALFVLLTSTFGLLGCSNQDGRYNVKNSWCAEKISPNISPKIEKITLSVDVLFKFDRSSLNDTLPEGVKQLNELVSYLSENTKDIETIKIVGYTDRIGSDNYNYTLGLARAETIKNYIVNNGINVEYIVESKGKLEPITDGCHNLRGDNLKSCLQPDRRIELFIKSRK